MSASAPARTPAPISLEHLVGRLLVVAPLLDPGQRIERAALPGPPTVAASVLLQRLVESVHRDPTTDRLWLLLVAVTGCFPDTALFDGARWTFDLEPTRECEVWLLRATVGAMARTAVERPIEVVVGGVLAIVDHSARNDLHTGVQRVVRSVMPAWSSSHGVIPVAWTRDSGGFRRLGPAERDRVLSWGSPIAPDGAEPDALLVPWRSVVVTLEVDPTHPPEHLHPLATGSGNAMVGIGYDCIPVVSADLVPWGSAGVFARYLETVKHMRRVAAISASAAGEFAGFASALSAQGLSGPRVLAMPLPVLPVAAAPTKPSTPFGPPLVVAVGSFEPRKNHLALLHAAEMLWREGLAFRLLLIGGMSWDREVETRIAELEAQGRPLVAQHAVSDAAVAAAYVEARFTVFASLHEGYGLPVAESLAVGTPVITSSYGSVVELVGDGGALLVDPRDEQALAAAMRDLLVDDALLARLRADLAAPAGDTWAEYADRLWEALIAPELAALS